MIMSRTVLWAADLYSWPLLRETVALASTAITVDCSRRSRALVIVWKRPKHNLVQDDSLRARLTLSVDSVVNCSDRTLLQWRC